MAALRRGEWPGTIAHTIAPGQATTIGVIATDAKLDKAGATKLAQMAHDGLARSINPVHTQGDGDTLFGLATGTHAGAANLTLLGALAAEVTALAVLRAVRAATMLAGPGLPSLPAARDMPPWRAAPIAP